MSVQDTTGQMVKNPLSCSKRGWCKRVGDNVMWVAGRNVSPEKALRMYYEKLPDYLARQASRKADNQTARPAVRATPVSRVPALVPAPITASVKACLTVKQLRDLYIAKKRADVTSGDFAGRSLLSTIAALDYLCKRITGPIDQLTNQQFADYRHRLAKKYETYSLDRFVTQGRAMFAWAVRNHHIQQLPPWGDSFNKVSAKHLRAYQKERQRENGVKKFSQDEIKAMLAHSSPTLQAKILLGINCALGNGDVAELTTKDFDLTTGILDYPRRKNHAERRAILWPETIKALEEAIELRAEPAKREHQDHIFLTAEGHPICRLIKKTDDDGVLGRETKIDGLSALFYKLMKRSGLPVGKRRNFYALRHTFASVASELEAEAAITRIMGHVHRSILESTYVHRDQVKFDKQLRNVADHVHDWLYGAKPAIEDNVSVISGI